MAGLKILVIEDDRFFQQYVNDLLKDFDVDLINAMDGEEGLLNARSKEPDLILTDIEIPKIQGFVLLNQLKEMPETADIPVILMSGKVERDLLDRHSRLSVHADGYLLKPFSRSELHAEITRVMGENALTSSMSRQGVPAEASSPDASGLESEEERGEARKRSRPLALVVDDSTYVLTQTGDLLKNAGLDVDVAMDGEAGLAKCMEIRPDIVLMDVQMPKSNGFVVCETLKKNPATSGIPVIIMSAVVDSDSFERHSRLKYHADAYLQKPFKRAELLDLVFGHLARDPESPGVQRKTGFIFQDVDEVPHSTSLEDGKTADSISGNGRKLNEARRSLDEFRSREIKFIEEIDQLQRKYDQLAEERKEEHRQWEDRRRQLVERVTLATRRAEESARGADEIKNSNLKLKMDAEAALMAKAEIEDQAKALLVSLKRDDGSGSGDEEIAGLAKKNIELASRLAEAEARAANLVALQADLDRVREENLELRESLSSMSDRTELTEEIADLKERLKLADAGTASHKQELQVLQSSIDLMKIEREEILADNTVNAGKVAETLEDFNRLQAEADTLRAQLAEAQELALHAETLEKEVDSLKAEAGKVEEMRAINSRLKVELDDLRQSTAELSGNLDHEREKSAIAVKEADFARKETEGIQEERKRAAALKREFEATRERLESLQAHTRILEKENHLFQERLQAAIQSGPVQMVKAGAEEELLSSRLNQLEQVLRRTVGDAQTALMDQKGKEKGLEERMNALVDTLEAEREEHRRERSEWKAREVDLKKSMEDFFQERSQMMGEELSRLYPIPAARNHRPLEVVRPGARFGAIAVIGLLVLIAILLGYLVISTFSGGKQSSGHAGVPEQDRIVAQSQLAPGAETG